MKTRHLFLALALTLALPNAAWASHCPTLMKKIDEILATNPPLDDEVMKAVKDGREAGEKLHKEGKHDKSVEELQQALFLLGE